MNRLAALCLLTLATACPSSAPIVEGSYSTPSPSPLPARTTLLPVPWAASSISGTRLALVTPGSGCESFDHFDIVESAAAVRITAFDRQYHPLNGACIQPLIFTPNMIDLRTAVGRRSLVHGVVDADRRKFQKDVDSWGRQRG